MSTLDLTLIALIACLVLAVVYVNYCSKTARPYLRPDDFFNEYCKLRQMINDWIDDENIALANIIEMRGKEAGLIHHLTIMNFKTVGILDETNQKLDSILRDTPDLFSYSRFLDLYRKTFVHLTPAFLQEFEYRYFQSFCILGATPYKHDKNSIKSIREKYPYLWLLEEIANTSIARDQHSQAAVVA